jgi:hypothetical protein
MSAETLREAARLMRERAEGAEFAIGDKWRAESPAGGLHTLQYEHHGEWVNAFRCGPCEDWTYDDNRHGYVGGLEEPAEHIASWHPAVALAVAAWLDACADYYEAEPEYTHDGEDYALAVARAYLSPGG